MVDIYIKRWNFRRTTLAAGVGLMVLFSAIFPNCSAVLAYADRLELFESVWKNGIMGWSSSAGRAAVL
jgi:hypothetical protein